MEQITVVTKLPLSKLPDYVELGIKRLSEDEVKSYQDRARWCLPWEVDLRKLKEFLVVDLGEWFMVRWA